MVGHKYSILNVGHGLFDRHGNRADVFAISVLLSYLNGWHVVEFNITLYVGLGGKLNFKKFRAGGQIKIVL